MPAPNRRILQLISTAGYYGAERVLMELTLHLRARGWDARIGVFRHTPDPIQLADVARANAVPVEEFPCHGQFDRTFGPRLHAYLHGHRINVLHTHGYKADIFGGSRNLAGTVRHISTCHNWLSGGLKLWLYQKLDLRALRHFDRVVAVSEPVLAQVRRRGIAPSRSLIIENGLDSPQPTAHEAAAVRSEFTSDPHTRLLMQIGRLSPEKGNDVLLNAFARALQAAPQQPAKLIFAGDGPERAKLEQLAAQLGVTGQVIFAGYRTDVPALLAACDMFVISSHYEGLPTVLLEAMAAGKPIIATHVGMIPRVLRNGEAGLLVPPGNAEILALTLQKAWQWNEGLAEMASTAQQIYAEHYSRAAMGSRYEALYNELLSGSDS